MEYYFPGFPGIGKKSRDKNTGQNDTGSRDPGTEPLIPMRRLAAEPRSTAGLLFPSQCPSGMILLTPCSMVWDWRVSRAGPILFYWPKLIYPYYSLYYFSRSLLPVYTVLLWGWGLRTDTLYSPTLSLALPTFLLMIIIIIMMLSFGNEPRNQCISVYIRIISVTYYR